MKKNVLRSFVDSGRAALAVRAAEDGDGRGKGLPAVGRSSDQKVAVLSRNTEHIDVALMAEKLAPEAGYKLRNLVPGFALIVRPEDKSQILRRAWSKNVHRREHIPVRMHHDGRRA